jgi:GNAT superfamily N-acetyltransferase
MAYTVRAADLVADRPHILRVWEESLPSATADHYTWVYERNPFGPVSTWVLEADDDVVGTATVMPRTLIGMGRRWRAGVTVDFAVAAGHRTVGPALMLQKALLQACRDEGFDVIYGFPVQAASRVQSRAGFTALGRAAELRKTLRSADALTHRFGAMARVAAPFVDAALRIADVLQRPSPRAPYRFAELSTFDARFDDFWDRLRHTMPLTSDRTSAYLNWRYAQCPHDAYHTLVMESSTGDRIHGFAVWSVRHGEFLIADVIAEDAAALMSALVDRARSLGATAMSSRSFGAALLTDVQRHCGFKLGESGRDAVMFVPAGGECAQRLADRGNWYLLRGDTDV